MTNSDQGLRSWRWVALGVVPLLLGVLNACSLRHPSATLAAHAQSAQTPAEHSAVAVAYRTRAHQLRAEAAEHATLADWWSSLAGGHAAATGTGRYEQAQHCRRLSANLAAAADETDSLAEFHRHLSE